MFQTTHVSSTIWDFLKCLFAEFSRIHLNNLLETHSTFIVRCVLKVQLSDILLLFVGFGICLLMRHFDLPPSCFNLEMRQSGGTSATAG